MILLQGFFFVFLRQQSEEYLLAAAQEGPIVVLNATKLRSDAIIITPTHVTSIGLPQLSSDSVNEYFGVPGATDDMKARGSY